MGLLLANLTIVLAAHVSPSGAITDANGSNILFFYKSHNSNLPSLHTDANKVDLLGDHSKSSTSSYRFYDYYIYMVLYLEIGLGLFFPPIP
jgi:hypothetical protein